MVDESMAGASGCSIDSSVAFIRHLTQEYSVDLFDRMLVTYIDEDKPQTQRLQELSSHIAGREDTVLVFDNLVKNKKELLESSLVPASQSWVSRFL